MDWPLIGLSVAASWFVFLLTTDIAALLHVPRSFASRAHSVMFFVALGAIVALGYVVAAQAHAKPCAQKVRVR
ncbi:MAG: hypothetical protein IAI50_10085 [Candidatus Eremiobacteraeota bacterium]|nr:hypothetical protein [Candidatus Eremiobacteraeota bacterium]